jgi:hypothetical protein
VLGQIGDERGASMTRSFMPVRLAELVGRVRRHCVARRQAAIPQNFTFQPFANSRTGTTHGVPASPVSAPNEASPTQSIDLAGRLECDGGGQHFLQESAFRIFAMRLYPVPAADIAKMRCTTVACASLIARTTCDRLRGRGPSGGLTGTDFGL